MNINVRAFCRSLENENILSRMLLHYDNIHKQYPHVPINAVVCAVLWPMLNRYNDKHMPKINQIEAEFIIKEAEKECTRVLTSISMAQ